jgi:hypothetical protein
MTIAMIGNGSTTNGVLMNESALTTRTAIAEIGGRKITKDKITKDGDARLSTNATMATAEIDAITTGGIETAMIAGSHKK